MKSFLILFISVLLPISPLAANVPETPGDTNANEALRAFLQLQEQLHASQLAIDAVRKEAGEAAARNAEALAATAAKNAKALADTSDALAVRLKSIEDSIGRQRDEELRTIQSSTRMMLFVAGGFAVLGIGAMVLMAFLQWRTINRLTGLSEAAPQLRSLSPAPEVMAIGPGGDAPTQQVQDVNARLASALDQLEKRILSLEQRSRTSLEANAPTNGNGEQDNGHASAKDHVPGSAADLVARGQALLEKEQAAEALALFEKAAGLDAANPEVQVRKGTALEKLGRVDEAISCFDRALEIDGSITIAYLHKGGLLNRMERFSEALECYEKALRTQENQPG